MVGWFGVRGIGSLYYLMYAIQHGLSEEVALELVGLTLAQHWLESGARTRG